MLNLHYATDNYEKKARTKLILKVIICYDKFKNKILLKYKKNIIFNFKTGMSEGICSKIIRIWKKTLMYKKYNKFRSKSGQLSGKKEVKENQLLQIKLKIIQ